MRLPAKGTYSRLRLLAAPLGIGEKMTDAYIHYSAMGKDPQQVGVRLRDALEAVAGDRKFEIVDSVHRTNIAIAGCMEYDAPGKAIIVDERDAESLTSALAAALGARPHRESYTKRYRIGDKELGGDIHTPRALLYVLY